MKNSAVEHRISPEHTNPSIRQPKDVIISVARAFSILELLVDYPEGLLPKEVSQHLQLNLSTCYHQLNTLLATGYVQRDGETGCFVLSHKILYRQQQGYAPAEIVNILHPHLVALQQATRESAYLSLWDGHNAFIADIVPSPQTIQVKLLHVGYSEANHAMAIGKAILSHLDARTLSDYLMRNPLEAYTPETITSAEALKEHLKEVAKLGYSLDLAERFDDIFCIGVPIFGTGNRIIASFGITTPHYRFRKNFNQFLSHLRQFSGAAGRALCIRRCACVIG